MRPHVKKNDTFPHNSQECAFCWYIKHNLLGSPCYVIRVSQITDLHPPFPFLSRFPPPLPRFPLCLFLGFLTWKVKGRGTHVVASLATNSLPNACSSKVWSRLEPGNKLRPKLPHEWPENLSRLLLPSQVCYQGVRLQQLGFRLAFLCTVLMWQAVA